MSNFYHTAEPREEINFSYRREYVPVLDDWQRRPNHSPEEHAFDQHDDLLNAWLSTYPFRGFNPCFKQFVQEKKPMNDNIVSVFAAPEPAPPPNPTEVRLQLIEKGTGSNKRVLLHIVDRNGNHANAGNLMSIYPDGTYKVITGSQFGSNKARGFHERNKSIY